ncbi:sporulation membrane protein YtaF [Symbiobacterium thermophilum]|uniref:sporulation membrane protein YtaF n=1 Tax=Symbiobacterium thermophilum TaxID=2734 RepID=UPI0035C679A8
MDSVSLVLLAAALSLDALMAGLLYGLRGIRVSPGAAAIVSGATALLLGAAMGAGAFLAARLPPAAAQQAGAAILAATGLWITAQTLRSHPGARRRAGEPTPRRVWRLRLGSVGIVVEILREPSVADLDRSGHINPAEALLLGVALALDSVAAGLGAGMTGFSPLGLPLAAGVTSFGLLSAGSRLAGHLPLRLGGRWAALHGVMLALLGLYRMMR